MSRNERLYKMWGLDPACFSPLDAVLPDLVEGIKRLNIRASDVVGLADFLSHELPQRDPEFQAMYHLYSHKSLLLEALQSKYNDPEDKVWVLPGYAERWHVYVLSSLFASMHPSDALAQVFDTIPVALRSQVSSIVPMVDVCDVLDLVIAAKALDLERGAAIGLAPGWWWNEADEEYSRGAWVVTRGARVKDGWEYRRMVDGQVVQQGREPTAKAAMDMADALEYTIGG